MTVARTLRSLTGNKVGAAIEELHRVEGHLHEALLGLADRHKVDHEVFHVARDLSRWSAEHVGELARAGERYGLDLDPVSSGRSALLSRVVQKSSELAGSHHEPTLLLLTDLRHLHRVAAGCSLDWEVLAQTAQATQDLDLLDLCQDCHPQTLRQLRWANAKVKEISAQAMVTG